MDDLFEKTGSQAQDLAGSAHQAAQHALGAADNSTIMLLLMLILVLAIFLGLELIRHVPSTLHTPLMSGSNAISGITIVGALVASGRDHGTTAIVLGVLAVIAATINVVGGYLVTDRMLAMFKSKDGGGK